jgi:hypothetical protein
MKTLDCVPQVPFPHPAAPGRVEIIGVPHARWFINKRNRLAKKEEEMSLEER